MDALGSYLFATSNGRNNENTVPLRPCSSLVRKRNSPVSKNDLTANPKSEPGSTDALRRVERLESICRRAIDGPRDLPEDANGLKMPLAMEWRYGRLQRDRFFIRDDRSCACVFAEQLQPLFSS